MVLFIFILVLDKDGERNFVTSFDRSLIGVINIDGVISSADEHLEAIEEMLMNDRVKGVILRVNSPGGVVVPTYEVFQGLKRLSEKKAMYVSMGTIAASGGYWVSLAGDKIYANPGTITGSIGVIAENVGVKGLIDKIGLKMRILKSGVNKDIGSPFRPIHPAEKELLQGVLDDLHQVFISSVLENRNLDVANYDNLFDGRVFTGNQAKAVGLIDEISDYYGVLQDIKIDLNLPDAKEYVFLKTKDDGLFGFFFGNGMVDLMNNFLIESKHMAGAVFWSIYGY
ncbi:MAG: signal peptide peptidase SppA [SAR324 cluster bacterium]|nr:signal peptide peptidase SppA [SAR324 cluster bacterium]